MIDWTQISGVLEFRRLYKILVCSSLVMLSLTLFLFLSSPSADTAETSNEASSSQTKGGAFDGKGVLAVLLNGFRRTRRGEADQLPLSQGDLSPYAQFSEDASPTPELFGHPVEEEGLEMVSHEQASQKQASHSEGHEPFRLPEEATFDASASEGSEVAGTSETRTKSVFCQGAHDEAVATQDWVVQQELDVVSPLGISIRGTVATEGTELLIVPKDTRHHHLAGVLFSTSTEGGSQPIRRGNLSFLQTSEDAISHEQKDLKRPNVERGRSVSRDGVINTAAFDPLKEERNSKVCLQGGRRRSVSASPYNMHLEY